MSNPHLDQWRNFIEQEMGKSKPKPKELTQQQKDMRALVEYGSLISEHGNYRHKEKKWKDLSEPEKIKACTRQSGQVMTCKMPNGHVDTRPIYCNLCEKCLKANALKLKDKIDRFKEATEKSETPGQWRKKVVADDTEAKSLKKRISRNQEGRYFEVAASDNTNEVYVYVEDEPGKDMDEIYGEPVSLDEIDHDAMYKANRTTGKKLSTGKAFKGGALPAKKDTIRVMIPHFILDDKESKAEKIIRDTNYLELADTPEKAKQLYQFQLKYIIKELKEAGIKILAIDAKFYNFDAKQLLNDWNRNVKYWMSINASLVHEDEGNMDTLTSRLYQKIFGEPEMLPN